MDLVYLVLVLALIGGIVYLITTTVPMPPGWARTIQLVSLIIVLVYLIGRFLPLPNVLPR